MRPLAAALCVNISLLLALPTVHASASSSCELAPNAPLVQSVSPATPCTIVGTWQCFWPNADPGTCRTSLTASASQSSSHPTYVADIIASLYRSPSGPHAATTPSTQHCSLAPEDQQRLRCRLLSPRGARTNPLIIDLDYSAFVAQLFARADPEAPLHISLRVDPRTGQPIYEFVSRPCPPQPNLPNFALAAIELPLDVAKPEPRTLAPAVLSPGDLNSNSFRYHLLPPLNPPSSSPQSCNAPPDVRRLPFASYAVYVAPIPHGTWVRVGILRPHGSLRALHAALGLADPWLRLALHARAGFILTPIATSAEDGIQPESRSDAFTELTFASEVGHAWLSAGNRRFPLRPLRNARPASTPSPPTDSLVIPEELLDAVRAAHLGFTPVASAPTLYELEDALRRTQLCVHRRYASLDASGGTQCRNLSDLIESVSFVPNPPQIVLASWAGQRPIYDYDYTSCLLPSACMDAVVAPTYSYLAPLPVSTHLWVCLGNSCDPVPAGAPVTFRASGLYELRVAPSLSLAARRMAIALVRAFVFDPMRDWHWTDANGSSTPVYALSDSLSSPIRRNPNSAPPAFHLAAPARHLQLLRAADPRLPSVVATIPHVTSFRDLPSQLSLPRLFAIDSPTPRCPDLPAGAVLRRPPPLPEHEPDSSESYFLHLVEYLDDDQPLRCLATLHVRADRPLTFQLAERPPVHMTFFDDFTAGYVVYPRATPVFALSLADLELRLAEALRVSTGAHFHVELDTPLFTARVGLALQSAALLGLPRFPRLLHLGVVWWRSLPSPTPGAPRSVPRPFLGLDLNAVLRVF